MCFSAATKQILNCITGFLNPRLEEIDLLPYSDECLMNDVCLHHTEFAKWTVRW